MFSEQGLVNYLFNLDVREIPSKLKMGINSAAGRIRSFSTNFKHNYPLTAGSLKYHIISLGGLTLGITNDYVTKGHLVNYAELLKHKSFPSFFAWLEIGCIALTAAGYLIDRIVLRSK